MTSSDWWVKASDGYIYGPFRSRSACNVWMHSVGMSGHSFWDDAR